MRESLRGLLLSVLFFALLIGGAPSMAAADLHSASSAHTSPGACNSNGGTWVGSGTAANPNGYCDYGDSNSDDTGAGSPAWCKVGAAALGAIALDATGAAILAGMGATMATPIGWGLGVLGLGAGLYIGYKCADNWFG